MKNNERLDKINAPIFIRLVNRYLQEINLRKSIDNNFDANNVAEKFKKLKNE